MIIFKSVNYIKMSLIRIAIVDSNKCKPSKCRQECKKICPVVKMGKLCIEVSPSDSVAFISETLCNGCNLCTKSCPFDAIKIIRIPTNLEKETIFRFNKNSFKLHRLPQPRRGQILGLLGNNGLGKSTTLKILAGKTIPNFGDPSNNYNWDDIIKYFRGSELQQYYTKIKDNELMVLVKPQYVDLVPKAVGGKLKDHLKDQVLLKSFELEHLVDREIIHLSGGELQRFCIAMTLSKKANVRMFDEPTSFLDVRQRILVSNLIRSSLKEDDYYIIVEHDLAILDYISDFVCLLTGQAGAYGVVSAPFNVRDGINIWLDGNLPTENLRFRDEPLTFRLPVELPFTESNNTIRYPTMNKKYDDFEFNSEAGYYNTSEITVLLGQNGLGKSTFIKMLYGWATGVSIKPQMISPKFEGTVRQLFLSKILTKFTNQLFQQEVIKPLRVDELFDTQIKDLSGGGLQCVSIALCLGKEAQIYLLDEPSSYLDAEMRMIASRVIRRYILQNKKSAFIVEHDFLMSTYLADKVIVFEGISGVSGKASVPQPLITGMNQFLKSCGITFRSDPVSKRARINKLDSLKDREQKEKGTYWSID